VAKKSGIGGRFYFGGFDLSGDVLTLDTVAGARTVLEVTGLDKSAVERILAKTSGEIGVTVAFNDATGQNHPAYKGLPTTDVIAMYCQSNVVGDAVAMLLSKQINFDWSRGADGSLIGSVQCLSNTAPLEWGTTVIILTTVSSTGDSASQDNGGSSSAGAAAVFQCTAFSGTDYTAILQDSSNNSTFETLISFTQITAVNKAERKTVTGTVDRYTRVNHSGTFTSVDVIVAIRRGTSDDADAY